MADSTKTAPPRATANARATANVAEYSVTEISTAVKRTVEDAFGYVRIRGEISGFRGVHASGHAYFSLKDENSRIEAVVWRSAYGKLKFKPEEGLEVVATGRITTYAGQSKYQIVVERLEPAGVGALMAQLEERRKKLTAEGLFAEDRKQPLPYLPRTIGVVTSPTGAVIRDILHRLADRFPSRVLVWPVRVQGDTSPAEVAAAIEGFNALGATGPVPRPDVLIVARGGGSLEDLWGFNDEAVVRAAAASAIPLISAVGHETDVTLIDHAADRRAPTPTAAAEMAVPVRSDLIAAVNDLAARLDTAAARFVERLERDLTGLARALPAPDELLAEERRTLDALASRIGLALLANAARKRTDHERVAGRLSLPVLGQQLARRGETAVALGARLVRALATLTRDRRAGLNAAAVRLAPAHLSAALAQRGDDVAGLAERLETGWMQAAERQRVAVANQAKLLEALSYRSVLARGFALVSDEHHRPVRSVAGAPAGASLDIMLQDGSVRVLSQGPVAEVAATPRAADAPTPSPAPARKKRTKQDTDESQGSLF